MRHIFAALFAVVVLALPWVAFQFPRQTQYVLTVIEEAGSDLAAVILSHKPKTVAEIQGKYNDAGTKPEKKVRILLVPGHEPSYGGAEYGSLKERDMTVELAENLQRFLKQNSRYEVFVARSKVAWSPEFDTYFKNNWDDIIAWQKAHRDEFAELIGVDKFQAVPATVQHNKAPNNVAYRLYGIDKWVNENDIDIAIHIHFNDNPRRNHNSPGNFSGFAIYVPEKQYYNSATTQALADKIFKRLQKYNPVSDLPGEHTGIVEDQDLIAVGSYNSLDAPSMLIEYSYIYEPQLVDPDLRPLAIADLAYETYLGLQDFFDPADAVNLASTYDTLLAPHDWKSIITDKSPTGPDVYALQTALVLTGDYPPTNRSKNDCPRTGSLGPCTKAALDAFQKKRGILDEKGMVGTKTLRALNGLYRVDVI